MNAITGLSYPFVVLPKGAGWVEGLRSVAGYWAAMTAAGTFIFCALLGVRAIAALVLPYGMFLRASNLLQPVALLVLLGGYFITPGPSDAPIGNPAYQSLLARIPSYWFLGVLHQISGQHVGRPADAVMGGFARRGWLALLVAVVACGVFYPLAYRRLVRRVIEQPDAAPAKRANARGRWMARVGERVFGPQIERAIVFFMARTMVRSRPQRVLLAAYIGVGLGIALAYSRSLLYPTELTQEQWWEPGVALTAAGFALLFVLLVGTRAVFAYPASLKANWVFRITAVHSPKAYFVSSRKAMIALGAGPVWLALAALYFSLWSAGWALVYVALMVAAGMILLTRLLTGFRKVPFACSYLPGKTDLRIKFGAYGIAFLTFTHLAAMFTNGMLETPARAVVLTAVLAAMTIRAQARWAEFAASPYQQLQFEDAEIPEVMPLSFRRDGVWNSTLHYADAEPPQKPLRVRVAAALKLTTATLAILAAMGFVYERVGERRDRIRYPQIGRSYDIGGRKLNLYCSGQGSPVVVFEGTQSVAGYWWSGIQAQVAGFTRACWYDRAGYGWSDPGPFPNHADSVARDLNKLLHAAQVQPPYVLVGHALGGFATRVFAGYYTGETAGLVLLDPFNEDTTIQVHNHIEAFRPGVVWLARTLGRFGWWRLMAPTHVTPPPGWGADEWTEAMATVWQAKTVPARIGEPPLWVSGELARAARGSLKHMPLLVLSGELHDEMFEGQDTRLELRRHQELARESEFGSQRVVKGSGYWKPFDTPEVVVDAVREMVGQVRQRKAREERR